MSSIGRLWDSSYASTPSSGGGRDPLAQAMQGGIAAFVERSREAAASQSLFVQAADGAGTALISVAAAIPAGITSWFERTAREVPRGVGATASRFVEVPVRGLIEGAAQLFDTARGWARGDLSGKDSFAIAFEVTSAIGAAALLVLGMRGIARGGGKLASGIMTPGGGSVSTGGALVLQGAGRISLAGGADLMNGMAMMSCPEPEGTAPAGEEGSARMAPEKKPPPTDEEIVAALARNKALRAKAAADLGIPLYELERHIKRLKKEGVVLPNRRLFERRMARVTPMEVYKALQRFDGDREKVMAFLEIEGSTLNRSIRKIRESGRQIPMKPRFPDDPLAYHPEFRNDWDLALELRIQYGDRAKAGARWGVSAHEVQQRILSADPRSPLARFQPFTTTREELLAALEEFGFDCEKVGRKLGRSPRWVDEQVINAPKRSRLANFKPKIVGEGVIDDALTRNNGNFTKAANELGIPRQEVYDQVILAKPESPLWRWRRMKFKHLNDATD